MWSPPRITHIIIPHSDINKSTERCICKRTKKTEASAEMGNMAAWWLVDITVRLAVLVCLVTSAHFLPPNGFRISGENFATHELSEERIDQLRSVYLPLMQQLIPLERYDEWVEIMNMPEEQRFEICRMTLDLEHASIFAALRKRAKTQGVGNAVLRQMERDFATLSSLVECTEEDYSLVEKMDMPKILISPKQWTHAEKAFSSYVARAWSALVMFPAKIRFRAPRIDERGIPQNAIKCGRARAFGTGGTGVDISLVSGSGGQRSELMDKSEVCSSRTQIRLSFCSVISLFGLDGNDLRCSRTDGSLVGSAIVVYSAAYTYISVLCATWHTCCVAFQCTVQPS